MKVKGNVKDFMRIEMPVVKPDASMEEVVSKMKHEDARVVLVKDKENIIGIITDREVLDCFANEANLSKISARSYMEAGTIGGPSPYMQINENSSIESVINLMVAGVIDHILVWKPGELAGVVSMRDIIEYLSNSNYSK